MFEKIVQKILSPILNEYVQDFNAQNMKIGLWSGEVVIKNVRLKKQIIKKLNTPFRIKFSRLGLLKMNIPWKSLGSSKIDVLVQGLELIVTQIPQNQWQCKNTKIIQKRKQELAQYCSSIIQDFAKKSANAVKDAQQDKGFFGGMLLKIIDNVQVTVKDIHIRYQDQITKNYSFGITLQQLQIFTVNKDGLPQFIDRTKKQNQNEPLRKKLILSNFGLYWNQKSEFASEADPHPFMQQNIARIKNNNSKMNYLILMSSNAQLYQRQPGKQYIEPQINLNIKFEQLKIKVSNLQLQQVIFLGQRLQSYFNQVKMQNRKKLTQEQMLANHKQFLKIFPAYYQKKATQQQLNRIQSILEKMQIENFQQGVKQYLQTKQKQKMVQQKIDSKKGWFSWSSSKQLTQQQVKQIDNFISSNFGLEVNVVKRPEDFYHIKVNFFLKLLNLSIANTKQKNKNEEGMSLILEQIQMDFSLREGGYILQFKMNNFMVDMYDKILGDDKSMSITHLVQKMPKQNQPGFIVQNQYARLKVVGNPLDKKNIDTLINLETQELLIQFDPKILRIAQDFADLKISAKNSEAALQTYGQIKNKVAQAATSAAQSVSKVQKKKNFIELNVKLNSINLVLFFDPTKLDKDIWAINLGVTQILSDENTLKKLEYGQDQPMQKYIMRTAKTSMTHYANKSAFLYSKNKNIKPDPRQIVLNDLGMDFQIQIFQKQTQKRPKIRARTIMHNVDLNLSDFTYQSIQKIGDCFGSPPVKVQSKIKQQVEKVKSNEKSQIMKHSKKIGIIYEQTKQPKKFIAVLSEGYIYMFNDKKDLQYTTYYYIRNSKFTQNKESDLQKKPFSLIIQNKVNRFVLGFDKQFTAEEWMKSIKAQSQQNQNQYMIAQQQQDKNVQSQPKKQLTNPNTLNFQLYAAIQTIKINTLLHADRKIIISITSLTTQAYIHEAKILAKITLKQIKLSDNIFKYKLQQLENFLYSQSIQGKQKLIDIDFEQLSQKHPQYKMVGAEVSMQVGKLVCNFKPQTVENVMKFFLPKPQNKQQHHKLTNQDKKSSIDSGIVQHTAQQQQKKRKLQKIQSLKAQDEKYGIKVNLKVEQISISLINRKTRVMFTKVGLTNFKLIFNQSNKKLQLIGGIQQFYLRDYSKYPNTIITEQENYTQYHNLIQTFNKQRDMIKFDIKILQIPNQQNKTMLIKSQLYDLKVSFIQQPVLRMINYLTEQLLPALTPTDSDSNNSTNPAQQAKTNKPIVKNDEKPENTTMDIAIDIQNVLTIVQPRDGLKQYLQLLIKKITVKNQNLLQPYIRQSSQKVLVQVYYIQVSGISIIEKFKNKQVKLTNDLNINLVCELIQNSPYYRKTYGNKYEPGMRISCKMTPFLMKINHQDYNFIMKCLFWNISYDDNADGYLFDGPKQNNKQSSQKKPLQNQSQQKQEPSQPMFFKVSIDRIVLCVTQNQIPLSVLFLGNINLNLTMNQAKMQMKFTMQNLYGTHLYSSLEDKNITIQKGMWNLFGYQRKLQTKKLYDLDQLVNIYSVQSINQSLENNLALKSTMMTESKLKKKPCISLIFQMTKLGDIGIDLKIQGLKIVVQLKNLLILSKLALMQPNIQPPKPTLPVIQKKRLQLQALKAKQPSAGKISISMEINNFLGSLNDRTLKKYVVMQGNFIVMLNMQAPKTQDQIILRANKLQKKQGRILAVASHNVQVMNFSFYFCNLDDMKNKRYILMPINTSISYKQEYVFMEQIVCLQSIIDGQLDRVTVECSITDLLNISQIAQYNLQVMTEYNKQVEKTDKSKQIKGQQQQEIVDNKPRKSELSSLKKHSKQIDKKALEQAKKKIQKKIKDVIKADVLMKPIQIRIINDCNNNFMPVLNFMVEQSRILFKNDAITTRLNNFFVIKMQFFNPKSGNWQPVIQTFKIQLDFLSLVNEYGASTKIIVTSSQLEELKQLKINISTQLISTVFAILQIAQKQMKSLDAPKFMDKQVSPYILCNLTGTQITIQRNIEINNKFTLPPLFKGPVKLSNKSSQLTFYYKGKKYNANLQNFGIIKIDGLNEIHLQFKMDEENKVNKLLNFLSHSIIKNATFTPIYCIRYNQKQQKIEESQLLQPGDMLPIQSNWSIQFSLNMNSFTPKKKVHQLAQSKVIISQSKKFKLSFTPKKVSNSHTIYMIRTPFVILNCLPKDLQIQFISNGKQVASKGISAQGSYEVFANDDLQNLKFKIICQGFYWSQQIWSDFNSYNKQSFLFLNDRQSGGTTIKYLFQTDQVRNQIRLSIFCPAFIVSQLQYDLQIYGNLAQQQANKGIEKYYKLGGQSEFWTKQNSKQGQRKVDKKTLVGSQSGSKIRICGKNCLSDFCEPIEITNLGINHTRVAVQRQVNGRNVCLFTNVGVQVQLKKMAEKADIYCKQITIRSRWIFYNKSQRDLMIKQYGGQKFYYMLRKDQKKPFYYVLPQLKQKPKQFTFIAQGTAQSIPVQVDSLGAIYFRLAILAQPGNFLYFKLNTQQIQSYLFYDIRQVNYQDLPYQVVVKSQKLQAYVPLFQRQLRKGGFPVNYINEIPQQPYNLQLYVRLIGSESHQQITVQADNLNFRKVLQFYQPGITQVFILAEVYAIFNDSKKYIVIDEVKQNEQQTPQYETQTINLKMQRISFSIIHNHDEMQDSFQAFYFYLQNLEFMMQQTNKRTRYQAKLQFMQLDQQQPFNIANPVIITPIKFKQFTQPDEKGRQKSIFNAFVQIDNSFVKNMFINSLIIDINDIVVKVGSPFIKLALQLAKQYSEVFKSKDQYLIKNNIETWKSIQPPVEGSKTFLKSIRIAPFTVQVSAQIRLNQLDQGTVVFFGTILNALGVVITNIEDAPIRLDGIVINDCIDSLQGINTKLITHYKGSVMKQLYKIFGSLNIIGNPVSLFRNISTGIKDMKQKPSEGLVQGPLEFGKGLAQGTSSLIAHSVGGALNSVQKATGSLASGLAALTFDKQFEQMRQKQKMKKPKHVVEGLGRGGKAMFMGFKQGVTGLFTKPVQNAKKQGFLGFLKGTAQGVTGLVVKPVTGVIDFASKTTQGLKNTALYMQDKPNEDRIRNPRVLYTESNVVRQYNAIDSKLNAIINRMRYQQKFKFDDIYFNGSFKVQNGNYLVILSQTALLVNFFDQKVVWVSDLRFFTYRKLQQNSYAVEGPPKNKNFWQKTISQVLRFQNKEQADKFERLMYDMKNKLQ